MSLKTKMALAVSVLVTCMVAGTGLVAISYFHEKFEENISQQQYTLIANVAKDIDDDFSAAQQALVAVARIISAETVADPDKAQRFLDARAGTRTIFDHALALFSPDGRLVAETPYLPGRRGKDFSFRDYYRKTVATGKPVISDPYRSSRPGHPLAILFTAPVFDARGKMVGILGGGLDLMKDNVLGRASRITIGKTGYVFIVNTDRTVIMHPDKSKLLKRNIPVGVNKLYDKAIAGFEGTGVTVNSKGIPMLASFKRLKSVPWIVGGNYPSAELHEPINRADILIVLTLGSAISVLAVWLLMKRFMTPLLAFTRHVAELPAKKGGERLLSVGTGDEIGALAEAFNGMVRELDEKQTALLKSAELYRTVAEFTTEMAVWRAPDKSIVYVSPNCMTITGYEEADFYRSPALLDEIVHPDDRYLWTHHMDETGEDGMHRPIDYRIVSKEGEVRWLNHTCYPVKNERGEFLGVRGSYREITDRKRAEDELRKLSIAVEQSPASIIITDTGGTIEYVNPTFSRQTGFAREEAIGQNPRIVKSGKTPVETYAQLWQTITAGGEWRGELLNRKKNGELYWELTKIAPIRDGAGTITHFMAIKEDVTERRKIVGELENAYAKLKSTQAQMLQSEKMASIGQLAAGVAHEINNPIGFVASNLGTLDKYLTKLLGFIAFLEEKLQTATLPELLLEVAEKKKGLKLDYVTNDARSLIHESLEGTDRVRRIVQDLKSFSHRSDEEQKPANLNECLESTISIVWNELKYKATLKRELGELPLVSCNPQELAQVFVNLLVNAAHAIETQGEITVRSWNEAGFVNIAVSDTGCGIPEEIRHRIFEPFFSTKEVGTGTGLGLSISYDIVRKHNGELLVASEVGAGTTFTVRLPVAPAGEAGI